MLSMLTRVRHGQPTSYTQPTRVRPFLGQGFQVATTWNAHCVSDLSTVGRAWLLYGTQIHPDYPMLWSTHYHMISTYSRRPFHTYWV